MSATTAARGRGRVPLTVVLACAVVFALVSPLRGMWKAQGDVNALRTEERALDGRLAALRAERDLLASDAEIELRARRDLGMVRPGETAVIIPGADAPPGRLPAVAEPDRPRAAPLLRRWWDAVRYLAGARV